jgi:hypothetical protein
VAAPAPAATPAPTAIPAPAAAPIKGITAALAGTSAPLDRKLTHALLVLREGKINGIYYQKGGLSRFSARLDDFDFLLKSVARLLPVDVAVTVDIGSHGAADDAALNRSLASKYNPDILVILTLDCRTQSTTHMLVFEKTALQAELQIDFLNPETLGVLAARTVQTDFLEVKGMGQAVPPALKDQLAQRLALALPVLPY